MAKDEFYGTVTKEDLIRYHLSQIQELYAEAITTLFIRHPKLADGNILLTNDDHLTVQESLIKFIDEKVINPKK